MNRRRVSEALWGYLFILPTLAGIAIFTILPAIQAGYLSLTRYDLLSPPRYVGARNYVKALGDSVFHQVMANTAIMSIGVPIGIVIAFVLATLLVDRKLRGADGYRAIFFLPVIMPLIAIGTVWARLFSYEHGFVNEALAMVGVSPIRWLTSYEWSKVAVTTVGVWAGFGGALVILMGGLKNIPNEFYEASRIDGASPWQTFRFITLPLIVPTLTLVGITSFIGAFQVFDLAMVLTGGGPGRSSTPIIQFIYQRFDALDLGYASTLSVLLFFALFLLSLIQFGLGERFRNR